MKRVLWLLPLLLLLACGPTTPNLPPADASVNTAVPAPADLAEAESEATTESDAAADAPPAANLDEFVPVTTAEEAARVRPQDWRKGAAEPAVVIIEYGDFQ